MVSESLYRQLVPEAPLYRRTDRDPVSDESRARYESLRSAAPPTPGLTDPRLHSTWQGQIAQILFAFPAWAVEDQESATAYRSVIGALRAGTEFVVVHAAGARAAVEEWFDSAGHADTVTYVPLPDYVSFTDWAEDAYVALADAIDDTRYLMEPWEFQRAGDALIADAVEEHTGIRASQAPLIFQGGNCLIGDDFWFLGTDYFADSIVLLRRGRSPVELPDGADLSAAVRRLFHDYVEAGRRLDLVGTRKPIAVPDFRGRREGDQYFLDLPSGGTGAFQPIFHIDMFVTLVGREEGRFVVLVGDPSQADELLGSTSPYDLREVYDQIAATLAAAGFDVRRNPLVHRSTVAQSLSLADLRAIAEREKDAALTQAVRELSAAGAQADTNVTVRDWHHVTWNNCLVENSAAVGRHVYLPTFGHGPESDLAVVDDHMRQLWADLGFEVHLLADFTSFARRQGVVHCIKKYLRRGD
ncbi:hypothetical protein [Blastococcus sp. CT_GayMR16]|uniref:hypothetical protein n=1 Tax=Blastococcus sp. CT_GayMR16 TaxID=2559607 RepID=UPI001073C959|nr:hypothetical protein [Blastococcus sp. CT_GayMR16]TFV85961.1 hypothetical protein E4P38_18275 [Blastococcus sp. CT_GayMR16]